MNSLRSPGQRTLFVFHLTGGRLLPLATRGDARSSSAARRSLRPTCDTQLLTGLVFLRPQIVWPTGKLLIWQRFFSPFVFILFENLSSAMMNGASEANRQRARHVRSLHPSLARRAPLLGSRNSGAKPRRSISEQEEGGEARA